MGSRANYILITAERTDYYYHHWGAQRIPEDLFWGPQIAQNFIQALVHHDELLDDTWCEGAVLMNLPQQQLMLYGGEDMMWSNTLKRMYLALLKLAWPGWQICWAKHELFSIFEALNLPSEGHVEKSLPVYTKLKKADIKKALKYDEGALVSIKQGTEIKHYSMHFRADQILAQGEKMIQWIASFPSQNLRVEEIGNENDSYLFVDLDKHVIAYSNECCRHHLSHQTLAHFWASWQFEEHQQGLYYHAQLCGLNSFELLPDKESCLKYLEKLLLKSGKSEPSSVVDTLLGQGYQVEVLAPHYYQTTQPELNQEDKVKFFSEIVKRWLQLPDHYKDIFQADIWSAV